MKIKWTEMDRIHLVEAVIKIEVEDHVEPSSITRKKWARIVSLLPSEIREKIWDQSTKAYNAHKCEAMFHELLRAYRNIPKWSRKWVGLRLTDPVRAVLKRYEALRKGRDEVPTSVCFKAKQCTGIKSFKTPRQEGKQSTKESFKSGSKMGRDSTIRADENKSTQMANIQWTETACLQLVKAVIQVEKARRIPFATGKRMRKWDWVDSLLPPHLQSSTRTH
jgi:hypothetical protein